MWHNYPILAVNPGIKVFVGILLIWSLVWKGVALWKAVRNNHTAWFVVMLILNTAGILEIIYILGFSKKSHHKE